MRNLLSWSLRLRARRVCYLPLDLWDGLSGRRDPLVPPRWLRCVGGGDYDLVGRCFLSHFRTLAGLRPDEDVLEVGCGVGRIARALAGYLRSGSYRGFDVVPESIRWCRRHFTPRHPHFRFEHADVYNAAYNPGGTWRASEFVFPYPDAAFDFVFLTSVFTHLPRADVAHYLAEVRRVLRPGGRCLATCFLLNADSCRRMELPGCPLVFRHDAGGCFTTHPTRPEAAVAYPEDELFGMVHAAGLRLREPVHFGGWCGREATLEGQDMFLADR